MKKLFMTDIISKSKEKDNLNANSISSDFAANPPEQNTHLQEKNNNLEKIRDEGYSSNVVETNRSNEENDDDTNGGLFLSQQKVLTQASELSTSYFLSKNQEQFKKEKSKMIEYLLKRQGKYIDLDQIEQYTISQVFESGKIYDSKSKFLKERNDYLLSLDIQINQEVVNQLNLSKNDYVYDQKHTSEYTVNEFKEKLRFAEHALDKYKLLYERMVEDKIILSKQLEEELELSKVNQDQHEKYKIIQENSFRTISLQRKLLDEMKVYYSNLDIELRTEYHRRIKLYTRLETSQINLNHNIIKIEDKLIKIKNKKESLVNQLSKIDKVTNYNKDNWTRTLRDFLYLQIKLEKIQINLKANSVEDVIDRIIAQKISFQSHFNLFNSLNKEITDYHRDYSVSQSKLQYLKDQIKASDDKVSTILHYHNHSIFTDLTTVKEEVESAMTYIEKKEKTYTALLEFFEKYEASLNASYFYVIRELKDMKDLEVARSYRSQCRKIYEFPKNNPCENDLKSIFLYFLNFSKVFLFLINYSLAKINVHKIEDEETLALQEYYYNKHNSKNIPYLHIDQGLPKPLIIIAILNRQTLTEIAEKYDENMKSLKKNLNMIPNQAKEKSNKDKKQKLINPNLKGTKISQIMNNYLHYLEEKVKSPLSEENRDILSKDVVILSSERSERPTNVEMFKTKLYPELFKLTNSLVNTNVKNMQLPKGFKSQNTKAGSELQSKKRVVSKHGFVESYSFDIKKRKKKKYNLERSHSMMIDKDDSFELNAASKKDINKELLVTKHEKNMLKTLPSKNEETKKMYQRIADLQYLNLNLFQAGTRVNEFKLDNNDFARIYSKFNSKK